MQGHGRIIAHDFCVAHREANSGLSTLNRTKSILSIYHQQRQLQRQRGMCLNDTYPFCQQPLSGNCHSICFSKPVLWTATPRLSLLLPGKEKGFRLVQSEAFCSGYASFYFRLSATATATATVAPTIGLLPMPRKPIISTCAGTEEEPAN